MMKSEPKLNIRNQLRQWYKNIPNLYHGSFRKIWIKALQRRSMKAAVTAKCQDCMGWQNAEVRECNIVTCPLWQYRPFRDKKGEIEAEVINIVTEIGENDDPRHVKSGATEGILALCYENKGSSGSVLVTDIAEQTKTA